MEPTPSQHIASRLRLWRTQRHLTASALAAKLGWERQVITKIETGRRKGVTIDELVALSKALEMPLIHMLPRSVDPDAVEWTIPFASWDELEHFRHTLERLVESFPG